MLSSQFLIEHSSSKIEHWFATRETLHETEALGIYLVRNGVFLAGRRCLFLVQCAAFYSRSREDM